MTSSRQPFNTGMALVAQIGILLGLFFVMLIILGTFSSLLPSMGIAPRSQSLIISAAQAILVFMIPPYITGYYVNRYPVKFLRLDIGISFSSLITVIGGFIIGLPFLNQVINWNEHLVLPEGLSHIEEGLRAMEDAAKAATDVLLETTTIGGLITGILVIGMLTGLGEEMFFRGGFQRLLTYNGINHHIAIWSVAVLFSLMHFQFYGFIPRVLLGAFFGYLLYWSGSLWVSVFAHALNNSMVVVCVWLQKRGIVDIDIENWGVTTGFPWIAIICFLLLICFLYVMRKVISQESIGSKG